MQSCAHALWVMQYMIMSAGTLVISNDEIGKATFVHRLDLRPSTSRLF